MKRILVTGCAGFIGSELVSTLLRKGHFVIGMDNFISGLRNNILKHEKEPNFMFIEQDVCDKKILNNALLSNVDQIFHLASPASPKFYQKFPFETIEANTIGIKNILELARNNGAKVVFSSTSEIYGDPEVSILSEDYNGNVKLWGPRACYDESKRLGEVYCFEYFTRYNVAVAVARIFNTYSAALRIDDGRVVSNFVVQALNNKDITVYGDGKQTRSFCYIDDTLDGLMKLMHEESASGQMFNLGHPKEYTILEVAELVKEQSNSKSNIVYMDLPIDDPKQRRPDISKASELLNWYPRVSLADGIEKTIDSYIKKMNYPELEIEGTVI